MPSGLPIATKIPVSAPGSRNNAVTKVPIPKPTKLAPLQQRHILESIRCNNCNNVIAGASNCLLLSMSTGQLQKLIDNSTGPWLSQLQNVTELYQLCVQKSSINGNVTIGTNNDIICTCSHVIGRTVDETTVFQVYLDVVSLITNLGKQSYSRNQGSKYLFRFSSFSANFFGTGVAGSLAQLAKCSRNDVRSSVASTTGEIALLKFPPVASP